MLWSTWIQIPREYHDLHNLDWTQPLLWLPRRKHRPQPWQHESTLLELATYVQPPVSGLHIGKLAGWSGCSADGPTCQACMRHDDRPLGLLDWIIENHNIYIYIYIIYIYILYIQPMDVVYWWKFEGHKLNLGFLFFGEYLLRYCNAQRQLIPIALGKAAGFDCVTKPREPGKVRMKSAVLWNRSIARRNHFQFSRGTHLGLDSNRGIVIAYGVISNIPRACGVHFPGTLW